jgi:adenosylhomocysteine nucleosidase
MWLRILLGQLVQQTARQKVQSAVTDAMRGQLHSQPRDPQAVCEIAFIFALNAESGPLTDMLDGARYMKCPTFVERTGELEGRSVVIAEVGVGVDAARRGTADCLAVHRPKWVVSAGFAGGLADGLNKGHLLMADEVVASSGEAIAIDRKVDPASLASGLHVGRLLTVDRLIREPAEKRSLGTTHHAVACDMESFGVAQACREAGVPFISARVISDTVDDRLPPEIEALLAQNSLAGRLGAATAAVVNRFSSLGDMWKLYEDALKCSQRLARFLKGVCAELR